MNEARVYADGFERSFAEVKDLLEFLAERGRNAKWIRKPTNTLRLAPLEKEAQNLDAADASMEEILEDTEKNTQLRKKLKVDSRNWNYIRTVRGVGYKFQPLSGE